MNFKTTCKYQVLDRASKMVSMANIMNRDKVEVEKPQFVFYDDESLSDQMVQDRTHFHEWGEYKVYHEGYLCPICNQFSLCFENVGCWD